MSDKISGTSKEPLSTDEMKVRSSSEWRVEDKGIFNLERICE